jgi:hypothetical protein
MFESQSGYSYKKCIQAEGLHKRLVPGLLKSIYIALGFDQIVVKMYYSKNEE